MSIDDFINSERNEQKSGGSNKKCRLFDEHVLLYGSFKEENLKKLIEITNGLKQKGIPVLPTLEYKVDTPPNDLGYVKGYILQQRAEGEDLYSLKMTPDQYKKRLKEVAQMSPQNMDKFVSDWLAIEKAGLQVDPSKFENFFYSNGKISFIDLNLQERPTPLKTTFLELTNILMGTSLKYKHKPDGKDLEQIATNVSRSFLRQGLSLEDIRDTLFTSSSFQGINMDPNSVIRNLTAENSQKSQNGQKTGLLKSLQELHEASTAQPNNSVKNLAHQKGIDPR